MSARFIYNNNFIFRTRARIKLVMSRIEIDAGVFHYALNDARSSNFLQSEEFL